MVQQATLLNHVILSVVRSSEVSYKGCHIVRILKCMNFWHNEIGYRLHRRTQFGGGGKWGRKGETRARTSATNMLSSTQTHAHRFPFYLTGAAYCINPACEQTGTIDFIRAFLHGSPVLILNSVCVCVFAHMLQVLGIMFHLYRRNDLTFALSASTRAYIGVPKVKCARLCGSPSDATATATICATPAEQRGRAKRERKTGRKLRLRLGLVPLRCVPPLIQPNRSTWQRHVSVS